MFELRTINEWRRLGSPKSITDEPRPHIIPLTDKAEKFVNFQLNTPFGKLKELGVDCFHIFYTGFSHAKVEDRFVLSFRFKNCQDENNKQAIEDKLQEIIARFRIWEDYSNSTLPETVIGG
jgi:hypothetical protein